MVGQVSDPPVRLIFDEAAAATAAGDPDHVRVLERATLKVGYYRPRGTDDQEPHDQDELYVVMTGSGTFNLDGSRTPFKTGDVLVAAARVPHRFEDFSDDFAAWVVFWGPPGGELTREV